MLNRHNLGIAELAASEESRFTLCGIQVTNKETVVTDGHKLVMCTTPKGDEASAPTFAGCTPTRKFKPFLLDKASALAIAKSLPTKTTVPILMNAFVGAESNENGQAVISTFKDVDSPQVFHPKKMPGHFPDFVRVMPRLEDATFTYTVNAKLLTDTLKPFLKFYDERCPAVTLSFTDANHALRIDSPRNNEEQMMVGVLMPMRDDHGKREIPQLESTAPRAKVSRLAVTQALEYLAQLLDEQPQLIFQGGLADSTAVQDRVLEILNDSPEVA